jgi:hypothetical protein
MIRQHSMTTLVAAGVLVLALAQLVHAEDGRKVILARVPDGGIQPQCMLDAKGVLHLIYFKGEPGAGDVFYVHSSDYGAHYSRPLHVNSVPGSVIAIGNVRGAQLALGKNGRVHVAWMGSDKAEPRGPDKAAPMLYTRLNDDATAFEPQRNVIHSAYGLNGGASIAADGAGNVYAVWHAGPEPDKQNEKYRCVWVAHSGDGGKTFAQEKRAFSESTGACGCCGMRGFADSSGNVYVLYRSATEDVHRDMYLLTSTDKAATFRGEKIHAWNIDGCPMSTMAFAQTGDNVLAAWETEEQVYCARIDRASGKRSATLVAPGQAKVRKHPAVAGNKQRDTILVWTEGMGWNKGGTLAWQVFDKDGNPTPDKGRARGVPTWSLVAVVPRPDGGFTILY